MQTFWRNTLPAMLWELWRISRFEVLMRFAFVLAFVLLIFFLSKNFNETQVAVIRGIVLMLLGIACVFSTTWMSDLDNQHAGFTFRLGYTRPISNLLLVLVPMAYSVATAMMGFMACAILVKVMLGQSLPWLGPALVLGCMVCVFTCVAWSSTHTVEKLIGVFLAALAIIAGLSARHSLRSETDPILLAIGKPGYFDLAWYEYLCILFLMAASVAVTVTAVGRQRYGEGLQWSLLPVSLVRAWLSNRWLVACGTWLSVVTTPRKSSGPFVTQCCFEARRSGHVLFVALLACALVLAFVVLVPLVNETWGGAHSPRVWLGAMAFSPLLYQLLATDPVVGLQHKQGSTRLSLFDATRPLRCDQMMAIKMLVVAAWSVLGFCLMALVAAIYTTSAGQWHDWEDMGRNLISAVQQLAAGNWASSTELAEPSNTVPRGVSVAWYLVGLCNLVVLYFCSTAMLMTFVFWMAKYHKLSVGCAILLLVHLGVWAWDVSHGRPLRALWLAYGYLIPISLTLASLVAIRIAISSGVLSKQYFAGALCLWSVYLVSSLLTTIKIMATMSVNSVHPMAWLCGIAILLLPLAITATAPLALAAYRHG